MAKLEGLTKLPVWQVVALWATASVLIVVGGYFLFYEEAQEERDETIKQVKQTREELKGLEERYKNYEQELEELAQREAENAKRLEQLPMSSSTIDHLIRTFNNQARLLGLKLESWSPKGEEKMEFYARIPVEVHATGSWHQLGEFFRRIAEMKQIVSVYSLEVKKTNNSSAEQYPILDVKFEASAYRFLSEEERAEVSKKAKHKSRRGGKAGK